MSESITLRRRTPEDWENESEGRPLSLARVDFDPALVVAGDVADDGEAEPGPSRLTAATVVHPVEALEDPLEVAGGDADPGVDDRELDLAVVLAAGDPRPSLSS